MSRVDLLKEQHKQICVDKSVYNTVERFCLSKDLLKDFQHVNVLLSCIRHPSNLPPTTTPQYHKNLVKPPIYSVPHIKIHIKIPQDLVSTNSTNINQKTSTVFYFMEFIQCPNCITKKGIFLCNNTLHSHIRIFTISHRHSSSRTIFSLPPSPTAPATK